jgi:hypothetical protein
VISRFAIVLAVAAGACTMNDLDPKKYVTIEEAEGVVGEGGLHVEKDTQGAFQYARADRTPLLRVRVGSARDYATWRAAPEAFRAPVAGLGDDAYSGPVGGREPTVIAIRKDSRAVEIMAVTPLPYAKLHGLAATAAGRM